jgi:DNA invertase Pin-like site-specific DNA recombinase
MIRAALIIRVSTEEQKKFGISVETQKSDLINYCKERGYGYDLFVDEGFSASSMKRPALQSFLSTITKYQIVLFTKLDRLSRNVLDANTLNKLFQKHNISMKAIFEDDIDTTTADGKFLFDLKISLAERELGKTSERIASVFKHKYNVQKTVCSGQKIYGYNISKDKKLVINKKEAENIKLLFEKFVETENLRTAFLWFRENIKEIGYRQVRSYLKNTAYIGKYKKWRTNEIIEDFAPLIVEKSLFNKAQSIFNRNIKAYGTKKNYNAIPYIFNGLLVCDHCKNKFSAKTVHKHHYYTCKNKLVGLCKKSSQISEIYLEEYMLKNIKMYIEKELLNAQIVKDKNKTKTKKDNIPKIKEKLKRLIDLYVNDMIDKEDYKIKFDSLNKDLDFEQKSKIKETVKRDYTELKKILDLNMLEMYKTFKNEEKRLFWRSFIDYITIIDKDNILPEFYK